MFRETARRITEKFGERYWRDIDSRSEFPHEFWAAMGKHGFLGMAIPSEYGGGGLGLLDLCIVVEEVASAGAGLDGSSPFLNGPVFGGFSIAKYGTEDQKTRYLRRLAAGDVLSLAMTEPEAGSNVLRTKTRAEKKGDRYVINGHKIFISMVQQCKNLLIVARTVPYEDVEKKTEGISLFIADMPNASVSLSPLEKCGMHTMNTSEVFIDNLEVPKGSLLGDEGNGWRYLLDILNPERMVLAACAVGTGVLAIKRAAEYAKQRAVWDQPIGAHQGIQFPLADSMSKLEAAKLLTYRGAWLFDRGEECGVEAASAKLRAVDAAIEAADRAMQTLGGYGYMREMDVERHWRNLRLLKLAPITQEMTLNFIARHGLGLPRSY